MPRKHARVARGAAHRRGAATGATPDAAVLNALKLARSELLKHAGVKGLTAIRAINKILEPVEAERTFEVTLMAVIEMKGGCPDLRLQVAQAFTEYIVNGLHTDPNYIAEVISFKEIL